MDEYSLSMACLFGALEPISRPSRQFDSLAFGNFGFFYDFDYFGRIFFDNFQNGIACFTGNMEHVLW